MLDEEEILSLVEKIRSELDLAKNLSDEELRQFIEDKVFVFSKERFLPAQQKIVLVDRIFYSFRGYDILQPLLNDKTITEIMINGVDEIFIEKNGVISKLPMKFSSQEKLEDIIQSIVAKVNRVVNESMPIVDARLKDGSRVNIVLPPIALRGPTMTIRKFPENPLKVEDLIRMDALNEEISMFLEKIVVSKYNIFISGGTGSGKTTFLNILSNFIPADERIVTIEDSAELQINNIPNLVQLETRNANTEGKGEITIRDLIKTSLRMRPNRIIVGEVRGAEALDMLQAMNTGHEGSLSTGHANSTLDMLSRLETMVLSGADLPVAVVRKQISSAIDIMIHLGRLRDHSRRVLEISEVIGMKEGEIQLNKLYEFVEVSQSNDGMIIGEFKTTGNKLQKLTKLLMAGYDGI
ncbi:pilus assembly protein [Vulcanibacillus modesticaldus]|uniref:Pilus assembly protein n=1 Tax=Vulcanibacillus modesticaldus TaxID=337097 RepID=A0A1D2YUR9_9BACI|nr:CpaF family protein [Vulcanibacillus modesticaldus]OEF99454.1 pilus assembly protein [Vulcanibacillus modesticaldus]